MLQACTLPDQAAITWMRYNNGWLSVIRNVTVKETHSTYYMDALRYRMNSSITMIKKMILRII